MRASTNSQQLQRRPQRRSGAQRVGQPGRPLASAWRAARVPHGPAHVLAGLHAPRAVPGQPACSKPRPRHGLRPFTGRHGLFSGVLCRAFCVPGSRALGRAAKSTARWPGLAPMYRFERRKRKDHKSVRADYEVRRRAADENYFGWTKAYFTDTDQSDCNIISRDT
jgi:hypothetical protein